MTKKSGGIWAFIKRLFGFGKTDAQQPAFPLASDEEIDAELNEPYVYDEEKAHREARETIAKTIEDEKIDPNDPDVFFERASAYSILNEDASALELLEKVLSLDEKRADAYRLKADIHSAAERYEEAVECLDRAISRHSDPRETQYLPEDVKEMVLSNERYEKSCDYQNRGSAYFYLENFEAAIDDFTSAIEFDPENDYLYSTRGEAYFGAGNFARALQDLNKSIELEETEYNYEKRAQIHKAMGNPEAALRDISKSIELNRQSDSSLYFDGYFTRGEIHMEKGDYNSAVQDFTTQIERDPEYIEPYEKRAAAYRALGMAALAEADELKFAELSAEYEESERD